MRISRWEPEFSSFDRLNSKLDRNCPHIVVTGSSTIRLWFELEPDFLKYNVLNRGFGGGKMKDIPELIIRTSKNINISNLIIYAGGNDIAALSSAENVVTDAAKIIETVKSIDNSIGIAFISIIPHRKFWPLISEITRANKLLEQLTNEYGEGYIDVYSDMVTDISTPTSEKYFIQDGIHLSKEGYSLLSNKIITYINSLPRK